MSERTDQLKAELDLVEAEEAFVARKLAGKLTAADRDKLRKLRQEYRAKRETPNE